MLQQDLVSAASFKQENQQIIVSHSQFDSYIWMIWLSDAKVKSNSIATETSQGELF